MKTICSTIMLLGAVIFQARAQQSETAGITTPVTHLASSNTTIVAASDPRKENARLALPDLIRGVFTTELDQQSAIITVDAGWRDDSLSIEYKYFRSADGGVNSEVIPGSSHDGQLVEKIYFTFLPSDIASLKTDNDGMLFLNISTRKNAGAVRKMVSGMSGRASAVNTVRAFGFPVQASKLDEIKRYLKELQ